MKKRRKRDEKKMATQIAPTPVLYGEDAEKVLCDAKKKPSLKSKENAKRFMEMFSKNNK